MMSSLFRLDSLRFLRATGLAALAACLMALAAPVFAASNVVISQVYGGGGNSGSTIKNDYIELYNRGAVDVDIGGWSVQYASATGTSWQVTAIPAGSVIPAGSYFLIKEAVGAGGTVEINADVTTGAIAMSGTSGKVALAPSTTALSGSIPATAIDLVGYGTATGFEGSGAAPTLSNTTAAFRAGGGATDTDNNAADFTAGTPAPRWSGGDAIPGGGSSTTSCAGTASTNNVAIYNIQGSGASSPVVGQVVAATGVVTKLTNNGFFIQDPVGDGNPQTSDGIFVFAAPTSCTNAVVGNLVTVSGTVSEFVPGSGTASTPLTELTAVTSVALVSTGNSITPTVVSLPLAVGDSFERFEGMLVTLQGSLTVQQNFFQAQYGQLTVGVGRHETPTNAYRPNSAQAQALAALQARSRLLLDDGNSVTNPNPTPYLNAGGLGRSGDLVSNLTGVIDFGLATATTSGAGLYRLQPTTTPVFTSANPRSTTAPEVGGNVRIAALNVLNFFTTFTNGQTADGQTGQGCLLGTGVSASNCRGADNITEFQRQRNKIVREMAALNADVYGIMETQNNGNTAVQNLVDALNAFIGSNAYVTIPVPAAGTGTDAIRVTMIYRPAKLTMVGLPLSDTNSINNRPTLAQTFMAANGEKFSFVVNHLKSKGSCPGSGLDTDQGDGQGCWNNTRLQQAQRLRTFIAQVQTAAGSNDVVVVGDFNSYAKEDPINDLTTNGYVDQIGRFNTLGYSYVFDGTAGRLDHAITSASLSDRVSSAVEWHINADESPANDYNQEFKQPACGTCAPDPYDGSGPWRASDHDPVLIGLNLYKTITGTGDRDSITGTPGDDIIWGGAGADVLRGNGGNNIFAYATLRDIGDTILDFSPSADKLDLRMLLSSLGYIGGDPIAAGYVRFTTGRNGAALQIDSDGPSGRDTWRTVATLEGVNPTSLSLANLIVPPAPTRTTVRTAK